MRTTKDMTSVLRTNASIWTATEGLARSTTRLAWLSASATIRSSLANIATTTAAQDIASTRECVSLIGRPEQRLEIVLHHSGVLAGEILPVRGAKLAQKAASAKTEESVPSRDMRKNSDANVRKDSKALNASIAPDLPETFVRTAAFAGEMLWDSQCADALPDLMENRANTLPAPSLALA